MKIGIVGKANVGKSTFFKAATLAEIEIANYPFTTIKPNHAIGYVKIKDVARDFGKVSNPREGYVLDGYRFVPVELIDVAGLVPGAHQGKGMGNQFLNDLNQADALIHIIDVSGSTNEKGEPVSLGTYNPEKDLRFLEVELDYWYFNILRKGWERFARSIQLEHKDIINALAQQLSGLHVTEDMIKHAIRQLNLDVEKPSLWEDEALFKLAKILRKLSKPMIIGCNKIDLSGAYENYLRLKKEFSDYVLIPCSADSELALKEAAKHHLIRYIPGESDFEILEHDKINEKQAKALEYIKERVLKKIGNTGIQQLLNYVVFDLLGYVAVFPVALTKLEDSHGNVLPDCFLMPPGSTALDLAYKVHTDIGKSFIKAIDLRTKKILGKDYVLKHLDIIEIVTKK